MPGLSACRTGHSWRGGDCPGLLNLPDGCQSLNLKNKKMGFTRTHFPAVINPLLNAGLWIGYNSVLI